jgi:hypothetical protein
MENIKDLGKGVVKVRFFGGLAVGDIELDVSTRWAFGFSDPVSLFYDRNVVPLGRKRCHKKGF